MMDAGKRDRRLTFQALAETKDSAGGLIQTYSDDFTRWASLSGLTGSEKYINGELIGVVSHKIGVIFDSKTALLNNKKYRAVIGDRYFKIISVINIRESNQDIIILAQEIIK